MSFIFKGIHRLIVIYGKLFIISLFLLNGFIYSQTLISTWEMYSSIDARLSKTIIHKDILVHKQTLQQEEIRKLQKSSSWYNGWYNKMLLSQKSAEQLELADSIQINEVRIKQLTYARQDIFSNLINTYRHILLDSLAGDSLSMIEKQNAVILGQWLKDKPKENISLPDYSHIINSHYEDIGIRNIVMKDMKILLEQKIIFIDSLLDERRLENELSDRLSEFHRDLGLQIESELDVSTSDKIRSFAAQPSDEYTFGTVLNNFESNFVKNNENRFVSSGFNPLMQSDNKYQEVFEENLFDRELLNLNSKRHQYQELLKRINKELNY